MTESWNRLLSWLEARPPVETLAGSGVLLLVAWVAYAVTRSLILRTIRQIAERTTFTWDDELIEHRVFDRLAHVAPAIVVYYGIGLVGGVPDPIAQLAQRVALALIVFVAALSASGFLDAVHDVYQSEYPQAKSRPIKGYLQILKIFFFLGAGIVVIATLMDQSPVIFLSGLGALTAVLLLVFRDTILSLVASVQIASNDMIRIGDWVEMPSAGADGDVIDIALHTVKIQNWDKTITTVPTYDFVSKGFKNWRGMSEAGGRRIKRSISLDLNTVRFLSAEEIERLSKHELLHDHLTRKRDEIREYNEARRKEAGEGIDQPAVRRLTNVGTFRAYVFEYLKRNPHLNKDMTLLVRQLAPGAQGVPIEIYCFSADTAWAHYEGVQGDIFDHLMAVVPDFGLRVFQEPAGSDFRSALSGEGSPGPRADRAPGGDPAALRSRD